MVILDVNELKPGMVLAKPIVNHQELLLLEAGAKITEKNIRIFKSWGITAVWVKGDAADNDPNDLRPDTASREAIELELKEKFEKMQKKIFHKLVGTQSELQSVLVGKRTLRMTLSQSNQDNYVTNIESEIDYVSISN